MTSCISVVKASEKRVQSVHVQGNNSLSLKNHCWFIIIIKVHNNNEIIIQQIMLLIHSYYLSTACVIFLIENLFSLLLQFPPSIVASLLQILALYVFPCLIDFFLVCLLSLSWAIPFLLSCLVVCFLMLALYDYCLCVPELHLTWINYPAILHSCWHYCVISRRYLLACMVACLVHSHVAYLSTFALTYLFTFLFTWAVILGGWLIIFTRTICLLRVSDVAFYLYDYIMSLKICLLRWLNNTTNAPCSFIIIVLQLFCIY